MGPRSVTTSRGWGIMGGGAQAWEKGSGALVACFCCWMRSLVPATSGPLLRDAEWLLPIDLGTWQKSDCLGTQFGFFKNNL
jgi:hypothetical protein